MLINSWYPYYLEANMTFNFNNKKLYLIELLGLLIGLGLTWAVALDIFIAFDMVWRAALLQILKSYRIASRAFSFISSFLSNRRLQVWSGIRFVAATRFDFWTWIWSMRQCRVWPEVVIWFQCWKISTCFVWPV